MSEHTATISWRRTTPDFRYESYSRDHDWSFDAGLVVSASASPHYRGNPAAVDPEEALVASIASCHMLTFLRVAARKRLVVDRYEDAARGLLEKNQEGRLAITRVLLKPQIEFEGDAPVPSALAELHELAHRNCFVANSVRCEIRVETG